jgi:hypothetical protein
LEQRAIAESQQTEIERLQRIINDMKAKEKENTDQQKTCTICMENKPDRTLSCGNVHTVVAPNDRHCPSNHTNTIMNDEIDK